MGDYTTPTERPEGKPWEIKDAADFLGVHPRTISRAADAKKVKLIHFGRKVMVPDSEVRRLAEDGL